MPTLWLAVILKTEMPVEEATLSISLAPELPWRLKVIEEEEALTPSTVPLSISLPVVKEVAPFQMATKPLLPEPVTEPAPAVVQYRLPLLSEVKTWPEAGVVVGRVKVRLEARVVVDKSLTTDWLVVEPVLKIKP